MRVAQLNVTQKPLSLAGFAACRSLNRPSMPGQR